MKAKIAVGITLVMLLVGTMISAIPTKGQFVGTIKIGIIGPVGLPLWSPAGIKEGAEMARDEINAAGGVHLADGDYRIELAFGDECALPSPRPEDAALEVERLITVEGVKFIYGGYRTETTMAMVEMAMRYNTPFFIDGAGAAEIVSCLGTAAYPCGRCVYCDYPKYKYLFRQSVPNATVNPYTPLIFLYYVSAAQLLPLYGEYLWPGAPNPQVRVAVVAEDLAWTWPPYILLTDPSLYPSVLGPYVNVTYADRIPPGATDLTTWLQGIIDSKARLIIPLFSAGIGVPFAIQWYDMGVKAVIVGINIIGTIESYWPDTDGKCEYSTTISATGTGTPIVPGLTDVFWDNFVARTGHWPMHPAFGSYSGICMWKEAIETAGTTDPDALVSVLEPMEYTGLLGKYKFTQYHDLFVNELGLTWTKGYVRPVMVQWQAGRLEIVSPLDQLYSKRFMLPGWMYPLITDLDYDGFITIADVSVAASAFGAYPGHGRWNFICDVDGDWFITISDVSAIAVRFGDWVETPITWPPGPILHE